MSELRLHRVIRLAQTSRRWFRTLRLTIRDWGDWAGILRAHGSVFTACGETSGEETIRVWLELERRSGAIWTDPTARVRLERHRYVGAWLTRNGAHIVGTATVAGRDGVRVSVPGDAPNFGLLPGTDRYRFTLDAERGVLLRAECSSRAELIAIEEAVEIAFDEELDPGLFEEPR